MTRKLLGMLTPSSNTVLETILPDMVRDLPGVTCHFGRFGTVEVAEEEMASGHFPDDAMVDAAELLAQARMDAISWNGTAGGWRGFDKDERLCARIAERTGTPASSSILALNEIFRATGVTRFALVTPYPRELNQLFINNYAAAGFQCVADAWLGISVNFDYSEVSDDETLRMVRAVASKDPQAIAILCTNYKAAHLVAMLEEELGLPIYDSVARGLWKAMKQAQIETAPLAQKWGRLFAL